MLETLLNDLSQYDPFGIPVAIEPVGLGREGRIVKELTYGIRTIYLLELARPIPFEEYVYGAFIKDRQALHREFERLECFLPSGELICVTADWSAIQAMPVEGLFVEYVEADPRFMHSIRNFTAHVIATDGSIVVMHYIPSVDNRSTVKEVPPHAFVERYYETLPDGIEVFAVDLALEGVLRPMRVITAKNLVKGYAAEKEDDY